MMDENTTRMSDEEISDALADVAGERYNPHVRLDEPGEDDCVVERIEMDFAIPVYLTHRHQRMLHDLASEICDYPPNIPLAGVHWPSGYGAKPKWSKVDAKFLGIQPDKDAPDDGEPTFDDTILHLETSARAFASEEERCRKIATRANGAEGNTPASSPQPDSAARLSDGQAVLTLVAEERNRFREAIKFIAELTGEALETARVGTGEEVALRHARRRAVEALEGKR